MKAAILGLLVNAALAIAKLVTGLLGHSHALVADAVESLADIFGSIVVWSGLKIASRPADLDHPYGHGKAEALAALFVALLLLAAAAEAVKLVMEPMSATTANRYLGRMGTLFRWAVRERLTDHNPAEALRLGADYLVVGRPIFRAEDPPAAARRILAEMAG